MDDLIKYIKENYKSYRNILSYKIFIPENNNYYKFFDDLKSKKHLNIKEFNVNKLNSLTDDDKIDLLNKLDKDYYILYVLQFLSDFNKHKYLFELLNSEKLDQQELIYYKILYEKDDNKKIKLIKSNIISGKLKSEYIIACLVNSVNDENKKVNFIHYLLTKESLKNEELILNLLYRLKDEELRKKEFYSFLYGKNPYIIKSFLEIYTLYYNNWIENMKNNSILFNYKPKYNNQFYKIILSISSDKLKIDLLKELLTKKYIKRNDKNILKIVNSLKDDKDKVNLVNFLIDNNFDLLIEYIDLKYLSKPSTYLKFRYKLYNKAINLKQITKKIFYLFIESLKTASTARKVKYIKELFLKHSDFIFNDDSNIFKENIENISNLIAGINDDLIKTKLIDLIISEFSKKNNPSSCALLEPNIFYLISKLSDDFTKINYINNYIIYFIDNKIIFQNFDNQNEIEENIFYCLLSIKDNSLRQQMFINLIMPYNFLINYNYEGFDFLQKYYNFKTLVFLNKDGLNELYIIKMLKLLNDEDRLKLLNLALDNGYFDLFNLGKYNPYYEIIIGSLLDALDTFKTIPDELLNNLHDRILNEVKLFKCQPIIEYKKIFNEKLNKFLNRLPEDYIKDINNEKELIKS